MNEFATWLNKKKGEKSIRQLSRDLGFSHSHLAKVLRSEVPPGWELAAKAAQEFGLGYLAAFRMAGLLPKENSAQGNPTLDAVSVEKVPHSVPQNPANVTNGAENA